MNYAYARVSAKDQNLQRQIAAFSEFGIEKSRIFSEKKSGKDFERKEYKRLLKKLNCGDLLVIKSIDRLGRNYSQIIEEWNRITNVIGADILVLDMPLLDTRTKTDTLVGKFISDIVLQVLSFVAENERESIKARQAEGIKIAHQKGVRFGRPSFVYSEEFLSVANDYLCKRIKLKTALQLLNINQSNFFYHIYKIKKNNENKELQDTIANEKAMQINYSYADIRKWLSHFRTLDYSKTKNRKDLIDTFIYRVILYDDKMKVLFHLKGGQQGELLLNLIFPDYPDGHGDDGENAQKMPENEKETDKAVSNSDINAECAYTSRLVEINGLEPSTS